MTVKVLCHIFPFVSRTVTSPSRLYANGGHSVSCPMANVHTRASDSYSSFLHASIPRLLPCMSVSDRTVRRFCLSLMTCAVRAALWFALLSEFTLAVVCMLLLFSFAVICLFLFVFDAAHSSSTLRVLEALSRRPQLGCGWYA